MRRLIIPDVHENLEKVGHILWNLRDQYEKVTFLGDIMDSFEWKEDSEHFRTVLDWWVSALNKHDFLLGNHDIHYLSLIDEYCCSGWSTWKFKMVRESGLWDRIQEFKFLQYIETANKKFLLTHAGLREEMLPPYFEFNVESFAELNDKRMELFKAGIPDMFLKAGRGRGGRQFAPGITWTDWNREFVPIEGLCQIVGHSIHHSPQWFGENVDLDCRLDFVGILDTDTEKVEIWEPMSAERIKLYENE